MAVDCCLHRRLRRKLLGLAVDGRVRMLRSLARRRQKMHGVWKFNNITPSQLETHPVAKLSQLETSWGKIVPTRNLLGQNCPN